ncbi:MAG: sugar transferase [Kineosporiaceae bacterium]
MSLAHTSGEAAPLGRLADTETLGDATTRTRGRHSLSTSGVQLTRLPRPDVTDEDPRVLLGKYQSLAVASDAVAATVAAISGHLIRFGLTSPAHYVLISAAIPFVWVLVVAARRGYDLRFLGTGPEEYKRVLDAGLALFTLIAVLSYAARGDLSRGYVLVAVPLTVVLTLIARHALRDWLFRLRAAGRGLQRVLVVGRADAVVSVIEKLDHEPQHGLVAVGACLPRGDIEVSHVSGVPVVGDPSEIIDAVDETGAHVVAVANHPDLTGQALRRLSWALEERGVELVVSPGIIEVAGPRLSIRPVAGMSLLHLERPGASGSKLLMKTIFDRVLGSLLLLVALPVMAVLALAIKLDDRGPVLFRQTRIGIGGERFTMLKFRSMCVDAEARLAALRAQSEGNEVLFKMRNDPRITRIGAILRKLSLDELPQLINVIRGDMSLVGPRPPLPEEVAVYGEDALRRLRVLPGLTGLWQVSGRSDLSWEESLRLDLRYVDNWSIALDLSILWRTGTAVLKKSGAY